MVSKAKKHSKVSERLTSDQIQQFRDTFKLFDKDGSGAIDTNEFGSAAAEFGVEISEDELEDLIREYDDDRSGQIDFEEFVAVMAAKLHLESSDDDDDDADVDNEADEEIHVRAFDLMQRQELVTKSTWLSKLATEMVDIIQHCESVAEDGADATPAPHNVANSALEEALHSHTLKCVRVLRTQSRLLPSDLPPELDGLVIDASTSASPTVPLPGSDDFASTSPHDAAFKLLHFIRECIQIIDAKVATMEEFETVSLDGRDWRRPGDAHGADDESFFASDSYLSLVTRTAEGKSAVRDEAAYQQALKQLTGFSFDVASAATSLSHAAVPRHMREIVSGYEDGQALHGSVAYSWYVRNRLRFGICPIEPVCDQLDLADDIHAQLDAATGGRANVRPQCPMGSECSQMNDPRHCRSVTHPCFITSRGSADAASSAPLIAEGGDGPVDSLVALCPLASDPIHMACFHHGGRKGLNAMEARIAELRSRLGIVDLNDRGISDAACEAFAFVLHRDGQRTVDGNNGRHYLHINVSHNDISPVGAKRLLGSATDLVSLDLSRNRLGRRGDALVGAGVGPQLFRLLQRSNTLTYLDISSNALSDADGLQLTEALKTNVVLRTLIMRNNHFGRATAADLSVALSYNRELRHLDVSYNRFEAGGSTTLLEELGQSSTLEVVDLSWTGVSDDGASHLAELLLNSTSIRVLHLAHNSLTKKGAAAMSKALGQNKCLEMLDLKHNPLGDGGLVEILKEITGTNTVLKRLDVRNVRASSRVNVDVARTRASNTELEIDFNCTS